MSSTSVVVKCLESFRMNGTAFGQITIGTLILQVSTRMVLLLDILVYLQARMADICCYAV